MTPPDLEDFIDEWSDYSAYLKNRTENIFKLFEVPSKHRARLEDKREFKWFLTKTNFGNDAKLHDVLNLILEDGRISPHMTHKAYYKDHFALFLVYWEFYQEYREAYLIVDMKLKQDENKENH